MSKSPVSTHTWFWPLYCGGVTWPNAVDRFAQCGWVETNHEQSKIAAVQLVLAAAISASSTTTVEVIYRRKKTSAWWR